VPVLTLNMT